MRRECLDSCPHLVSLVDSGLPATAIKAALQAAGESDYCAGGARPGGCGLAPIAVTALRVSSVLVEVATAMPVSELVYAV